MIKFIHVHTHCAGGFENERGRTVNGLYHLLLYLPWQHDIPVPFQGNVWPLSMYHEM